MADAIQSELDAHSMRGTWSTEPIYDDSPEVRFHTIGTQWVYATKNDLLEDGKYLGIKPKARLVARGDHQNPETYNVTFAPTLMLAVLRLVIAVSIAKEWRFYQIDIDTAYLNASIPEDTVIYIRPPKGLKPVPPRKNGVRPVFRLKRALYGTKQAGRLWYDKLYESIINYGFLPTTACSSIYTKTEDEQVIAIMAVFVDDIPICAKSDENIRDIIEKFKSEYGVKDLGYPKEILRTRITHNADKTEIYLDRQNSIEKMLRDFNIKKRKLHTPLPSNFSFSPEHYSLDDDPKTLDRKILRMRLMVGSILHIAITVRPDVSYAATLLARYVTFPHDIVMRAAERTIAYLYHTRHLKITFKRDPRTDVVFYGFSDSGFQKELELGLDIKYSSLGHLIYKNGLVDWKAARSKWVCDSIGLAEETAMWLLTCNLTFMNKVNYFLEDGKDLEDNDEVHHKNLVLTDNKTTIQHVRNEKKDPTRTGHWSPKLEWVRQLQLVAQTIDVYHIDTERNPADLLTKPTSRLVTEALGPALFDFTLVDPTPLKTHIQVFGEVPDHIGPRKLLQEKEDGVGI